MNLKILQDSPEVIQEDLKKRFREVIDTDRLCVNAKGIYYLPEIVTSELDYTYVVMFEEDDFLV